MRGEIAWCQCECGSEFESDCEGFLLFFERSNDSARRGRYQSDGLARVVSWGARVDSYGIHLLHPNFPKRTHNRSKY